MESSSALWLYYLLNSYNSCKPEMLLQTYIKNMKLKLYSCSCVYIF